MKKRILIVDDEKDIIDILTRFFASDELEVHGFEKAHDAIAFIETHECDVIITDIMMPGIKGYHLCSEVRKIEPTIQFVIMTGYPTRELFSSLLAMGISDIFTKPFDFKKVRSVVLEACGRSQNLKKIASSWRKEKA